MKKKKRMYYYDLMVYPLTRSYAEDEKNENCFLKAPNKKAIKKAGVKLTDTACAGTTPFTDIKLGKKYRFKAGDTIEFVGIPIEVVKLWGLDYLKIIVGDKKEVEVYSHISPGGHCLRLKIIEEIKE